MDKLKLMICDDEQSIRQGLKFILDWDKLGFKICGEASNGQDAVNYIKDLNPDLVILDIKMPGKTGVEVIAEIKEWSIKNNKEFPSFIILSGFSDFEYAQKTVNSGAKAYLLKPVDEDQLESKVCEIAKDLLKNKSIQETSKKLDDIQSKDFLISILNNPKNVYDNSIIEKLSKEDIFYENYNSASFSAIVLNLNLCDDYDLDNINKSLNNYFSFFKNKIIQQDNKIIILLNATNIDAVYKCVERTAKLNAKNTFITLGNTYIGIDGIRKSYEDAIKLQKQLFFLSKESFIYNNNCLSYEKEFTKENINNYIKRIIFCIETYDKKQLEKILKELKNELLVIKEPNEAKNEIVSIVLEIKNILKIKFPERDIDEMESQDVIPIILSASIFEDAYKALEVYVSAYVENFNFNTSDSIIVKVLAYIKSNYNQDLKLENLGEQFNCNSAYLGKKFKKYTNVQFNTYLDNIRIEAAKDKLKNTDLKIYQISKIVGYTNTDYFFMKFKKNTGITPKEFRRQIGKSDE